MDEAFGPRSAQAFREKGHGYQETTTRNERAIPKLPPSAIQSYTLQEKKSFYDIWMDNWNCTN